MVLGHAVSCLSGVSRDALSAGDVNECVIAGGVRLLGHRADCLQLFRRVDKALVTSGNIVIHFDAEDVTGYGALNNLIRIVRSQAVAGDANEVGPVLVGLGVGNVEH